MSEKLIELVKDNATIGLLIGSLLALSATFGMSPMEFVEWLLHLNTNEFIRLLSLLALFFLALFVAWRREPKGKKNEEAPANDSPPVA